jgi:hypothetical protein
MMIEKNILNQEFIENNITTDNGDSVPYLWTHGGTKEHMGDGILIYSLIQHMRSKTCVCIGSGGGYIPRIMTQARLDLHRQKIFDGNPDFNWGDIGVTYLVDACNGVGGPNNLDEETSFFRSKFYPRFIKSTSVDAYYDFFVRQNIKIDLLFIDGDHSYDGVKIDFELYSKIISDNGIIVIHDTDSEYEKSLIVSEDNKKDYHRFDGPSKFIKELQENSEWNLINLFNFRILNEKPSSSGITIVNRRK